MNLMRDPDALIAAWLDENALPLPTETRRAIAVDVRTTPQRQRPIWPLRRYPFMITPLRIAAVAALGDELWWTVELQDMTDASSSIVRAFRLPGREPATSGRITLLGNMARDGAEH